MIPRSAAQTLAQLARQYKAVAVIGPRQSGKTTLTKLLFPEKAYVNFENPDEDSKRINIIPEYTEKKIDCFLSNSFGFGGTNSSLIIKKFIK